VTFNCLNQTKLVSTALCVYLLFGTKQSYAQVFALALLLGSALVLQADSAPVASAVVVDAAEYRAGLVAILVASVLSVRLSSLCLSVLSLCLSPSLTLPTSSLSQP
jgi:UDP-sugar transporter A1/2/3